MEAWGLVLAVVGFIVLYRMLGPSTSPSTTGSQASTASTPAQKSATRGTVGPPPVGHLGLVS